MHGYFRHAAELCHHQHASKMVYLAGGIAYSLARFVERQRIA
jgi:hypothetical protein